MRKIILFEINELPWEVVDWWIDKHADSALARIVRNSQQFETMAPDLGELHPWSTWPTVHRGVSNEVHEIRDFGEDLQERNQKYPPVWKILTDNDVSVGLFGSLHSYPIPSSVRNYRFYIPDSFAQGPETHPGTVEIFQDFALTMARKSSRNVGRSISWNKAFKFILSSASLGISPATFSITGQHLLQELLGLSSTGRRRVLQALLSYDIYFKLLRKTQPQFSTFFSNHIAATLHRYWAATFPDQFDTEIESTWIKKHQVEIPYALQGLDNMLNKLKLFVDKNEDYLLWIASSMGQKATSIKRLDNELVLKDPSRFWSKIGFDRGSWEQIPAMHPQYNFRFQMDYIDSIGEHLNSVSIEGQPLYFRLKDKNQICLDLWYNNLETNLISVNGDSFGFEEMGLEKVDVDEHSASTAYHSPEGMLAIYDPAYIVDDKRRIRIDTREIGPMILQNFRVAVPDYMSNFTQVPSHQ